RKQAPPDCAGFFRSGLRALRESTLPRSPENSSQASTTLAPGRPAGLGFWRPRIHANRGLDESRGRALVFGLRNARSQSAWYDMVAARLFKRRSHGPSTSSAI